MKKYLFVFIVLVVAIAFIACQQQEPLAEKPTPSIQDITLAKKSAAEDNGNDKFLVLFKGKVPAGFATEVEAAGGEVFYTHDVGLAIVKGLSFDAANKLGQLAGVKQIQQDDSFELDPITDQQTVSADDYVESPDDPSAAYFYARQWHMRAIHADQAWAVGRLGSPDIDVAILDTGIDYEYPDLEGRVDLSRSISFVPLDDQYVDAYFPGKHYVTDLHFHGTHVAATTVSNGLVAAGVTSKIRLMGIKVCSVLGGCEFSAILSGILYAVDNGAEVINMSLGGGFEKAGSKGWVGFINKLFNYANSAGVTVVVSAGNEAIDLDHDGNYYKTYCSAPNVICVSATGPTSAEGVNGPWTEVDAPAPYTNYGRSAINVAAPGGTYLPESNGGWVWAACSQTSLVASICQTGNFIIGITGTSMAAPHVSGLAALMVEDYGRRPGRVKTAIQQSADDLGQNGTDPFYGKGRINVAVAVEQ